MSILSSLDDLQFKDNQSMLSAIENELQHLKSDVGLSVPVSRSETDKLSCCSDLIVYGSRVRPFTPNRTTRSNIRVQGMLTVAEPGGNCGRHRIW